MDWGVGVGCVLCRTQQRNGRHLCLGSCKTTGSGTQLSGTPRVETALKSCLCVLEGRQGLCGQGGIISSCEMTFSAHHAVSRAGTPPFVCVLGTCYLCGSVNCLPAETSHLAGSVPVLPWKMWAFDANMWPQQLESPGGRCLARRLVSHKQ